MSKVSLRLYNREIESKIEAGRLDEAVAQCQHILKTFPMHVETYKLLGKSFLEARRYADAADIFQRTLMAVPDDFVAHVGMSIIRDDEGKLDDGIWHMERAFEDQPSNTAIQSELRRLYGRRDGIEPPKIRLSRDALANMYSQGELFNQAIDEIRAVLAEDSNRPDLQVMLARAYFHAGQKVEAAEVAANLLKKYPYCLDALRVLVDVVPEGSQTENTQIYRQRLHMLDPYSSFVAGSVFTTDQVADAAVSLERLEYIAGAVPASPQPNWASSLGIKLADEKHIEPTPDWLAAGDSTAQSPIGAPESSDATAVSTGDDKSVPDWMRTAGWKDSKGKVQEEPAELGAQKTAEPLAKSDIPDWLKSMAPPEIPEVNSVTEPVPANPSFPDQGDAPEWLNGLGTIAAENTKPDYSRPSAVTKDTNVFPDWLKEMDASASSAPAVTIPSEKSENQEEETPASGQPASSPPAVVEDTEAQAASLGKDNDIPFQPTGESKPVKIEDDAMAWLESLAAKQGAKEEELLIKPENRSDEMPDWLRTPKEIPAASAPPDLPPDLNETLPLKPFTPSGGDLIPETPAPFEEIPPVDPTAAPALPLNFEVDREAWMEGLATTEQNAKPGELQPQTTAPVEEIPSVEPAIAPAQPLNFEVDRETWLEGLATTEQKAKPGELQPQTTTPVEEIPSVEPVIAPAQPLNIEVDREAWLDGLSTTEEKVKPGELQPETNTPVEETQPVKYAEGNAQPFNIEDDTEVRLEGLTTIEPYAKPGELHSQATTPAEEIPPEKPADGNAQQFNIEDDTEVRLEGLTTTEDQVKPGELQPQTTTPADEIPPIEPDVAPSQPLNIEEDGEAWLKGLSTPEEKAKPEELQSQTITPAEETPPVKSADGNVQQENIEDDNEAWLDGLAATEPQGMKEELPSGTSERPAAPPDWIQKPTQESNVPEKPAAPEPPLAVTEEDITITSWLSKHDVEEALGKARSKSGAAQAKESPANDLPDWLKEQEPASTQAEEPKSNKESPEWLSQPVQPSDMGTEAGTVPDLTKELEMPTWVEETIPASEPPAPTSPGEWVSVDEKPVPIPDITSSTTKPAAVADEPPLQRQILGGTGMLSRVPPEDKDAEFLAAAQTALDAKQIKEALHAYSKLIRKNRLLDEVIHDLREAIYRFPVDISIWQTLGDASMRANRLQDALDAYTKAEELLR
jgi:tetratricopeptide (TPR) repeat protein